MDPLAEMTSHHSTPAGNIRGTLDMARAQSVPIKELADTDRALMLEHLLALGPEDRYLRFGNPLSDEIIARYVDGIDFSHDSVFGIYDDSLKLAGAGHFAALNETNGGSADKPSAEFGLSVAATARGKGYGTALFVRASTHARNLGVRNLFMHCLTQNKAMMRIARKAGMEILYDSGEADAYLALPPGDVASAFQEAVQQQLAVFDYAIKRQVFAARRAMAKFPLAA